MQPVDYWKISNENKDSVMDACMHGLQAALYKQMDTKTST